MNPSSLQEVIAFSVFAALALASAVGTVAFKNPIRGAVSLFVHILALAGLYITLSAHFLMAVQLIVYIGAVVVLFVFMIMMLGPSSETPRDDSGLAPRLIGVLSLAIIGTGIGVTVFRLRPARPERLGDFGTIRHVGEYIFGSAVLPFEVASVLLTAAMVGAFAVARGTQSKVKMSTETNPLPSRHADAAEREQE